MENKTGLITHEVGEIFVGFVLIKDVRKDTARNGKAYLKLTLTDATGEVSAMVWDADEEKEAFYQPAKIIKVQGTVSEYQGNKQITLSKVRSIQDTDEVDMSELVETAPVTGEALIQNIYKDVADFENQNIKKITHAILKKYEIEFKTYPAAKSNHHAYVSGLAYHTVSMLNLADAISRLYPLLNRDLLFAGVILHDMGKIKEYTDDLGATDVTKEGRLLGHISMMNEEIGQVAKELGIEGEEEVILLQHMVLSHHGKLEWGSPVQPIIPEAEILHLIDNIDAKMDTLKKALKNIEVGGYTDRLFSLDNRSFYRHKLMGESK